MHLERVTRVTGLLLALLLAQTAAAQQAPNAPLPDIRQLMKEVQAHQKQLDKVRENYTYSSLQTTQDMDSNGQVKKTETMESEDFFVNSHVIERTVKKNGQPLSGHDQRKETERVTKLVEKAEKTPPGSAAARTDDQHQPGAGDHGCAQPAARVFRGRPTIVFDFVGRKDAKTHGHDGGCVEEASGDDLDR